MAQEEIIFPNNIRNIRMATGMKMTELARQSHLSLSAVSKIEKGVRRLNQKQLLNICNILGCKLSDIFIKEDDAVIDVVLTNGRNELILANKNGRAIRFNEDKIRVMGRTATGVRAMTLDGDDDEVVGMVCVYDLEKDTILVVSEKGFGKRSAVEDYRITNRGGKGVKTLSITEKTGKVVSIINAIDERDLMIINKSGTAIRISIAGIRVMGRATQGVKLIDIMKRKDEISSICSVISEQEEEQAVEDAEAKQEEAEGEMQESVITPVTDEAEGDELSTADDENNNDDNN